MPLEETVFCMEKLKKQGKIKAWGVSNFDTEDMRELLEIEDGKKCAVNQVLYHLGSRGIEYDLLGFQKMAGIPVMAYCPLAQGGTLRRGIMQSDSVKRLCQKHGASPAQIMLSFVLLRENVIAIPKASTPAHVLDNAGASLIWLDEEDRGMLDDAFAPPKVKTYLDIV